MAAKKNQRISRSEYAMAREGTTVIISREAAAYAACHQPKAQIDFDAWNNGDECFLKNGFTVKMSSAGAFLRHPDSRRD